MSDRGEKVRSWFYLGLVGAVVIGLAVTLFVVPYLTDRAQLNRIKDLPIDGLGVPAAAAGCQPRVTEKVTLDKSSRHVDNGTALTYDASPPAFGLHWSTPLTVKEYRTFFADDRPAKELLVHSLEHGYTIIWYDATLAADAAQIASLREIMAAFKVKDAVVAAPWNAADGGPFPAGSHLALTHWSDKDTEQGVWQYCTEVSGAAIKSFLVDYPHADGPEGGFA